VLVDSEKSRVFGPFNAHGTWIHQPRMPAAIEREGKSYGKRFALSSTGRWIVKLAALAVAASAVYRIVHSRIPCHRFDLVHQAKGLRLRAFPSHARTHTYIHTCVCVANGFRSSARRDSAKISCRGHILAARSN